jgi:hypothetical protein
MAYRVPDDRTRVIAVDPAVGVPIAKYRLALGSRVTRRAVQVRTGA